MREKKKKNFFVKLTRTGKFYLFIYIKNKTEEKKENKNKKQKTPKTENEKKENEKENEKKKTPSSVQYIVYSKNARFRGTWSQGWVGTGVRF